MQAHAGSGFTGGMDAMGEADAKQVAQCRHCQARYNTGSLEPGKLFSCSRCGHVLQAPGTRKVKPAKSGPFGEVALEEGMITPKQLEEALAVQASSEKRLGDILVQKGWLKADQVRTILEIQGAGVAEMIPGYEIVQKLGQGGMGAVYKALHRQSGKTVAIKVLDAALAARDVLVERFHREARTAIQLDHPHIVKGYEAGEAGGVHFFAMEYIHGKSIGRVIRKKLPGEKRSLDIVRQIAKALEYAHAHGIIHRDIKPDNIMIDLNGKVKLADYGLVKFADDIGEAVLTTEGQVMGTPRYISPEQAAGSRQIDIRSDIYSLGATLFHLLTGKPPFRGPGLSRTLRQHIKDPVPDPRSIKEDLSEPACRICMKMMAKRPGDRYQTPEALLAEIRAYFLSAKKSSVAVLTPSASAPATSDVVNAPDSTKSASSLKRASALNSSAINSSADIPLADPGSETMDIQDEFLPLYRHPWVQGGAAFLVGLLVVLVIAMQIPGWLEKSGSLIRSPLRPEAIRAEAPDFNRAVLAIAIPPNELQAARILREGYLAGTAAQEASLDRIHQKLPDTPIARVTRPAYDQIRDRLRAEEEAAERQREEEAQRQLAERIRESQEAFVTASRESDERRRLAAFLDVANRYPDLPGGTLAREQYETLKQQIETREAETLRLQREREEAQRLAQEHQRELRLAPERRRFLEAYLRHIKARRWPDALQDARDLASREPELRPFLESCIHDMRDMDAFYRNVSATLENATDKEITFTTQRGDTQTVRLIRFDADRGRIHFRVSGLQTQRNVFDDLSLDTLATFYAQSAKPGEAPPELALALHLFATQGEDIATRGASADPLLQAFRAASASNPRKMFHEELLRHLRILPDNATLD